MIGSARVYAGVGSRKTPFRILKIMEYVAYYLALNEFALRSGGASGADAAFEKGAQKAGGVCKILLPWQKFNGHSSPFYDLPQKAFRLAAEVHPCWTALPSQVHRLHARNTVVVLGEQCSDATSVEFILCWTPEGREVGGTGQALRLAKRWGISVFNMGAFDRLSTQMILERLSTFLQEFGTTIPIDSRFVA
jgi:hypothetical protein